MAELDFTSIREKVHTDEQKEQLGIAPEEAKPSGFIDFSSIRPEEETAPEIVDSPTSTIPDNIQQQTAPIVEPPIVEPKITEFIPAAQKGYAGLQASEGQISLDQSEWNKKHPYLATAKAVLTAISGGLITEQGGFGIDENRFKEITGKVEKWNQEAESKGELMNTDDINSLGDFVDYFQTMLASSGPQMGISILSGGTMTPLMMTAELNSNLKDIEGLSLDDRMALASGGGVISAALENLGLGFIIRGVPKEVVAKIGIKKLSAILEKSVLLKGGAKVTGSGLASMGIEGTTEGLQEAVAIISENLGGREFKPGEITYRLKQAIAAGMTVGGPMGGAGSAVRQSLGGQDSAPVKPEAPYIPFGDIRKVVDAVGPGVAPTAGTEAAVDTYLPEVAEVETSAKPTGVIRKAEPFKIAPKPTVETVETVEKAVPEESPKEVSTPPKGEVSPTLTGQPVTKKITKKSIEFELAKKQAKEKEAKAKREEAEAKKEVIGPVTKPVTEPVIEKETKVEKEYVLSAPPDRFLAENKPTVEATPFNLTIEELKERATTGKKFIKEAKKMGLDVTPVKNDIKAVVKELKLREAAEQKQASVETKENVEQAKLIKEQENEVNKAGIESDLEDTFYTEESEGKTVKGTTPEVVKKEVEKSFGKNTIRKLTKNDGVEILATQKELEEKLGGKKNKREDSKGAIIKGAFSKGKVYLVAENINEGEAGGVLLHEVGEHAALKKMVGDVQYEALSKNFDELVNAKDPIAIAATERIPPRTPASKLKSEKLAYLVEEVQNKISAGEKVSSKARTVYNRVVNLIRNWLRKLPAYRKFEGRAALKRLQKGELLTPENIASLARAAVDFHATTDKKSFKKDMVQFSEEAETDIPTTGININDSKQPFTKQIISGEKTIETRNTNSLKGQVGKRIGIIKTGKGKSQVVAYATVGEPIVYNTKEEFRKDQDKHLVEEGSEFDIKEDGMKYGYPLTDVEKVTPFPVTSKGIVSRKIDQPPVKKEIEVDMEEVIDESEFTEQKERFEKAKVKNKKASPLDSVKEAAERAKNIFTRSHPDLDPKKFGQTLEYLRQVQDVPSYAQWQTFQDIYEFLDKMSDAELEVFTYNIILPDMVKDLESGVLKEKDGELPFGYESLEQVKRHLKLNQQKARKTKTESGKTIEEAIAERNETMANLKNELIDEGLLSEELRNDEAYYHHQVIQFMEMDDKFKGDFNVNAQKAGVRTKKQGWQKARTGSIKDYNTSYLDSEFAVMSMMRSQLETKKLLDKIEVEENKFTEIEAQAKEEETTVEDLLRNSEDWKDYTIWKPNPDSVWFHTYTLNDKVAQEVLEQVESTDRKIKENKEALEKGEELPKRTQQDRTKGVEVTESDVGEAMIKGEDEKWIIPKELAKTLNNSRKPNEGIAAVSAWTLQTWKKWVLLNPERFIKYNLNNSSGDIDIAVAYDFRILGETKQAAKDLFHDLKKHKLSKELKEEMADARKKGVIDSGFAITEVDDFSRMYDKLFNGRPSNMKDETWVQGIEAVADDIVTGPKKLAKGYWKTVKEYTTLRENILRLAAFRYFKKKIAKNPSDKIYAASKSYEIDQIKDDGDRAAKLTRELIGDYGNISHAGQFIREHLMPFWSWTEINTPRYIRLLANSAKETNPGTAAKKLAKMVPGKAAKKVIYGGVKIAEFAAMTALVSVWNHTFFPEEEEKLSEFERGQLHILLPNVWQDGEVVSLRFSGAFSDALSWLSLHDSFSDYVQGKTVGEQFEEMWKAPINKLAAGLTPTAKVFYETVTGVATWPDVFNPRPIRDRWKHIAKVFSASIPYDWWTGKPSRGWGKNLSKLLLQSSDPGEAAYYKVRGLVRDFNDKAGDVSSGGFTPTDKGNALYYFKQSLRYGDMEAAERYLRDYVDLAGGPDKASKGLKASIDRTAPMGGLKKKDREAWLKSLTQAELKTLKVSRDWFKTTYRR